jgi:hypothetical protein
LHQLNPNNFYHSGTIGSGKLTSALRQVNMNGDHFLVALLEAISARATADGSAANVVTHADGLLTEFATPATFNKIVQTF